MNRKTTFAFGFIAATALAFPAFAQGQQQHHGEKGQGSSMMGNQGGAGMGAGMGNHKQMMQMMMRMHRQMMGGGGQGGMGSMGGQGHMMGGMGKTGSGPAGGMMMGGMKMSMMDADNDGTITAEEVRKGLTAKLKEFDADGNGSLSIAEFEALHSANIREKMVDRFQGFDNDGDGQVTLEEMTAPASRMERMLAMKAQTGGMGQNMQGMGSTDGAGTTDN